MLFRYAVPAAALVGGLLAANGTFFLLAPAIALRLFGLDPDSPEPLAALLGIREIAFGLAILVLARRREVRSLADFLLLGAVVPVVDAVIVTRANGLAAAVPHLAAIPVCLILGATLSWVKPHPSGPDGP